MTAYDILAVFGGLNILGWTFYLGMVAERTEFFGLFSNRGDE